MKLIQRINSEKLQCRYSANHRVNSIVRTLVAFHGHEQVFGYVSEYIRNGEANNLAAEEIWELYQAAKWAQYFKE